MRKREGFILRIIGDEAVLVPTGALVLDLTGVINLNTTGRCIWEHLDSEASPEQLAVALVEEFEVSVPEARRDVMDFLAELERLGAIER